MVGIDGTLGSLTATTHRAGVTEDNRLLVEATGSNAQTLPVVIETNPVPISGQVLLTGMGSVSGQGIDKSTQSLQTLSYEHHEIHGGKHYNQRGFESLSAGDNLAFGFTTPNGSNWTHLVFEVTGTNQTEIRGWEGATISGGITQTPMNNNRNSTNTCSCIVVANPSVIGGSGLLIESHSQGLAGTPPTRAEQNGTADREDEWILKSGTTYLWEIKAIGDSIIDYAARFYEHTDKVQQF